MNLRQYAAQQPQNAPQTQEAQPVEEYPLDTVQRKIEATEALQAYSSLVADMQKVIAADLAPGDMLAQIIAAAFGADSLQAAAVDKAVRKAAQYPGGLEMQIADVRAQKAALQRKQRRQAQEAQQTAADLQAVTDHERALLQRSATADSFDRAIADVLTFAKVEQVDPSTDFVDAAGRLYDQHRHSIAAMTLLHGCIREQYSRWTAPGSAITNLDQLTRAAALMDKTAAAAQLTTSL